MGINRVTKIKSLRMKVLMAIYDHENDRLTSEGPALPLAHQTGRYCPTLAWLLDNQYILYDVTRLPLPYVVTNLGRFECACMRIEMGILNGYTANEVDYRPLCDVRAEAEAATAAAARPARAPRPTRRRRTRATA